MRNLLRKLHIGQSEDAADGTSSSSSKGSAGVVRAASPLRADQNPSSGISGWLNSVANRHGTASPPPPPPTPAVIVPGPSSRDGDGERVSGPKKPDMDVEEYQIQLALEMSAKEDPEAAQIEAVKQISLGSFPTENTPAEVLAYRYWKYNALSYDDKILDGFYDLYGISSESDSAKMPSLIDLQGKPVSDGISWEAVLVNRAEDAGLLELQQKALLRALELKPEPHDFAANALVQSLAILVANHMGGAISNPIVMLKSWRNLSSYLRASTRNIVLPLGCLTIGLARHRALLFKVLADSLSIPCRLVKGKHYTGSDDGALNIVKLKDGRECIVDLMADPGALISSDGAGLVKDYVETSSANSGVSSSVGCCSEDETVKQRFMHCNPDTSCSEGVTSTKLRNREIQELRSSFKISSNQAFITTETSNADDFTIFGKIGIGKAQEPPIKPDHPYVFSRSPSWTEGLSSPAVRMMKVKDISQYMINATKENPELAQRLHDVLLESGVVAPPNLFTEIRSDTQEIMVFEDMKLSEDKGEVFERNTEFRDKQLADGSHGPLPYLMRHGNQQKVVSSSSQLNPLKPVEGLGFRHPLDVREAARIISPSLSEATAGQLHDAAPQFLKHMPVAAAAATAAVVASSMVVAAAKSNTDLNLEVPVAAAVVATTAAVNRQYEQLESFAPAPNLPNCGDNANSTLKNAYILDNSQLGGGHRHVEQDTSETHQETERTSDKSTENGSAKSDISLDEVADLEIPWEDIILGERIGLGSFGEVYHGDWHGTEVAVKKFLHQDISTDALEEFISESDQSRSILSMQGSGSRFGPLYHIGIDVPNKLPSPTQVRIMKRVRHPNVVLLMGAVTRVPNLSIVTEFLPRGSLFRLIHRPNNQLDERKRLRMALDVAHGMNYLHNSMPLIVHRDLKSPNLLVDKNWVVKVCDFGLSRMKHNTFLSSRSTAGTAEWMAPEVLRNEPSDEKCDVFSFGVILWELCTFQQPWRGMNPMQVVGAVGFQHRRLDIPDDVDPVIADVIKKCWHTDPKLRPSFSEIMSALKPLQKPLSNNQVQRQRAVAKDNIEKGISQTLAGGAMGGKRECDSLAKP